MASIGSPTITFAVRGPIERADLPGLSDRVCKLLADNAGLVVNCDVAGVAPDVVTIEALARLQLVARRNACRIRLRNASNDLVQVVALMGLSDVLPDS
jgi:ABC-type transporter Mla MlaB component